mgnify:CR=1 FL=1
MMVQTLIIAFYVIIVDIALKAYLPTVSRALGPYVGLIITNCIIMGRAEAFYVQNRIGQSLIDAFSNGLATLGFDKAAAARASRWKRRRSISMSSYP